jgi:hypothetical protein
MYEMLSFYPVLSEFAVRARACALVKSVRIIGAHTDALVTLCTHSTGVVEI